MTGTGEEQNKKTQNSEQHFNMHQNALLWHRRRQKKKKKNSMFYYTLSKK